MRTLIITLLFAAPAFAQQPKSHSCTTAPETQRTFWGNMNVRINLSKPMKELRGIVSFGSAASIDAAEGVLVEVFPARKDDSDWRPGDPETARPRLYACFTGARSAFEFDAPSGFYFVVASMKDCETTIALVNIDRKHGKRKGLTIPLEVGT